MMTSVKTQLLLFSWKKIVVLFTLSVLFKKGSFELCVSAWVRYETGTFHPALLALFEIQLCGLKQLQCRFVWKYILNYGVQNLQGNSQVLIFAPPPCLEAKRRKPTRFHHWVVVRGDPNHPSTGENSTGASVCPVLVEFSSIIEFQNAACMGQGGVITYCCSLAKGSLPFSPSQHLNFIP